MKRFDVPGWALKDWPVLNAEQLHELTYLRFSTVEQLAGANDSQVQKMGIGGIGLREQARQALKERARADVKAEMEAQEKLIADLKAKDEAREKELAAIRAMLEAKTEAPRPKRKYTRRKSAAQETA